MVPMRTGVPLLDHKTVDILPRLIPAGLGVVVAGGAIGGMALDIVFLLAMHEHRVFVLYTAICFLHADIHLFVFGDLIALGFEFAYTPWVIIGGAVDPAFLAFTLNARGTELRGLLVHLALIE